MSGDATGAAARGADLARSGPGRTQPLAVVRVSDGRAGHDNMSRALLEALARRVALRPLTVRAGMTAMVAGAPPASLVLGAGHHTHLTLLAIAKRCRARSIVLLNPSLPRRWFDLCIIPRHDAVAPSDRVITTAGVLNRARAGDKDPALGLIMVGGPSAHHSWIDRELVVQVVAVARRSPAVIWRVATSRRTPPRTARLLAELHEPNLRLHPVETVDGSWLPEILARAATAWVSEDSVSMIYEALSAGAATGILRAPRRGSNRVVQAVTDLVREGTVSLFSPAGPLPQAAEPLAEADRCAALILSRLGLADTT